MSTLDRIKKMKDKLLFGSMLALTTVTASAQSNSDSNSSKTTDKEQTIKKDANMDLLLKIFNKEFEESYKILEQKSLTQKKHSAMGVPQGGAVRDAVEFDPLEDCSTQNNVINLGSSSVQRAEDGHFTVTLTPDYFLVPEDKPDKPIVISTKDKLSTEELENVHANLNWVLIVADGEYKNADLLYECADKLIHGEKLTKSEQNNLDKVINGSTSYAFHQMMQNYGNGNSMK